METGLSIDFDATNLTKEDESDLDLQEEEQQRQVNNVKFFRTFKFLFDGRYIR